MDYRITSVHKLRTRLGFKQYDVILTKEQSMLTAIMSSFEGENMQTQYVLSYKIYSYFYDCKLAIEIDEIDTATEILTTKLENKKQQNKNLVVNLLEWNLTKKTLVFLELSMK